jgi:hypothetical protein
VKILHKTGVEELLEGEDNSTLKNKYLQALPILVELVFLSVFKEKTLHLKIKDKEHRFSIGI